MKSVIVFAVFAVSLALAGHLPPGVIPPSNEELFNHFDVDQNGVLEGDELTDAPEDAAEYTADGVVTLEEFQDYMHEKQEENRHRSWFYLLDKRRDGSLDLGELVDLFSIPEELWGFVELGDKNFDGKLTFEELGLAFEKAGEAEEEGEGEGESQP